MEAKASLSSSSISNQPPLFASHSPPPQKPRFTLTYSRRRRDEEVNGTVVEKKISVNTNMETNHKKEAINISTPPPLYESTNDEKQENNNGVKRWGLRTNRKPAKRWLIKSETANNGKRPLATCGRKESENKRRKFSVALSKEEIKEDFIAMTDHQPPRRPKKRPRTVQMELDCLFPGAFLKNFNLKKYDSKLYTTDGF